MSDIFISHVKEDSATALELAAGLEAAGYATWYYERDIRPGRSHLEQTSQAIEAARAILLLLSSATLTSHEVDSEVDWAYLSRKPFVPVLAGLNWEDFEQHQRKWRRILGSSVGISIPTEGVPALIPGVIEGLKALGIQPKTAEEREAEAQTRQRNEQLELLHNTAMQFTRNQKWGEAAATWRQYLALEPEDAEAAQDQLQRAEKQRELAVAFEQAQAALFRKDYDTAIKLLKGIVAQDESYGHAARLLADTIEHKMMPKRTRLPAWQIAGGLGAVAVIVILAIVLPRLPTAPAPANGAKPSPTVAAASNTAAPARGAVSGAAANTPPASAPATRPQTGGATPRSTPRQAAVPTPTRLPVSIQSPGPTPIGLDTAAAVPIRYGDVITQEIKPSGNVDTYVFDGLSSDIALIAAAGTADAPWLSLRIQVVAPDGRPVGNEAYRNGEFPLASDGRYAFTVRESSTRIGPYTLALKNAAPGAGVKIGYTDVITEEISFAGEVDVYTFTGRSDDTVYVALTDLTENARANVTAELIDPQGKSLASCNVWVGSTAAFGQTLTTNGEYTIKVRITGQLHTPETGPYVFLLKNTAPSAGIRLSYGDIVAGTIAPEGDVDVYTFEWQPGKTPSIEVSSNDWRNKLNVEIFDSQRNSLAAGITSWIGNAQVEMARVKPSLTDEGTYVIVVQHAEESDSGAYTLSLKDLALP